MSPNAADAVKAVHFREAAIIAEKWAVQWNGESGPRTAQEIAHELRALAASLDRG